MAQFLLKDTAIALGVLIVGGVGLKALTGKSFGAESERTFTVSKGPKRMYIVVEYNDGKELFLDGDGQKQFMEELAEAEATGDEILVEKIFGVGSDYHGIAEEVVEAEEFEADEDDEESYLRYRYGEPLENISSGRKIDEITTALQDISSEEMLITVINNLSTKQANQLLNRLMGGIREGWIRTQPFLNDAESFNAETVSKPIYLLYDTDNWAQESWCYMGTEDFLKSEQFESYYYTFIDPKESEESPDVYDNMSIEEVVDKMNAYVGAENPEQMAKLLKLEFGEYGYSWPYPAHWTKELVEDIIEGKKWDGSGATMDAMLGKANYVHAINNPDDEKDAEEVGE